MRILLFVTLLTVSFFCNAQSSVPGGTVVAFTLNKDVFAPDVKLGQSADFTVTQDVLVKGKVVIPANAKVRAAVVDVEKGGPHHSESRIKVQIYEVTASDGSLVEMEDCFLFTMGDGGHKQRGALLLKGSGKNCVTKKTASSTQKF